MSVPGAGARPPEGADTTVSFPRAVPGPTVAEELGVPQGATAEESSTVAALPWGSALLVMRRGPLTGERFLLDADRVSAGRSEQADIFLDDVTVSRKHAEFLRDGSGYAVRDTGSLNGTYVNRNRIDSVTLSTGDEVQIGKFRMTYFASQASAPGGASEA